MKITSKVDIIIPCKNEATPLPFVIKDFVKYFPNSEIIVIDSASDDDTLKTIKNLKKIYKNITIIESNSPGKGRAVKLGIGYSKSNYSIIVDGDYTYRAKDAKSLFNLTGLLNPFGSAILIPYWLICFNCLIFKR